MIGDSHSFFHDAHETLRTLASKKSKDIIIRAKALEVLALSEVFTTFDDEDDLDSLQLIADAFEETQNSQFLSSACFAFTLRASVSNPVELLNDIFPMYV